MRRLTVEGNNSHPLWSPDGERIAYGSDGDGMPGIFWRAADSSGVPERLTTAEEGVFHYPESFSPDGDWLSFRRDPQPAGGADTDVWILSTDSQETTPFAAIPDMFDFASAFSPDGRWLTYTSGVDINSFYLYAEPFPQTGERRRIGENIGVYGVWSQDGTELVYRRSAATDVTRSLVSISISTDPSFNFTTEQDLFGGIAVVSANRNFDILPDGERFVAVFPPGSATAAAVGDEIHVVLNWFEELTERVPVP